MRKFNETAATELAKHLTLLFKSTYDAVYANGDAIQEYRVKEYTQMGIVRPEKALAQLKERIATLKGLVLEAEDFVAKME